MSCKAYLRFLGYIVAFRLGVGAVAQVKPPITTFFLASCDELNAYGF